MTSTPEKVKYFFMLLHGPYTLKHHKTFKQIWEFSEILGYFHKYLAILYAIATRYGLFGTKFEI